MTATQRIRLYAVALTALVVLFAIGAIFGPRRTQSLGLVFPGLEETGVQQIEISSGTVAVTLLQVAESILEPQEKIRSGYQPVMSTYKGLVSDQDITAIIEFIKDLANIFGDGLLRALRGGKLRV